MLSVSCQPLCIKTKHREHFTIFSHFLSHEPPFKHLTGFQTKELTGEQSCFSFAPFIVFTLTPSVQLFTTLFFISSVSHSSQSVSLIFSAPLYILLVSLPPYLSVSHLNHLLKPQHTRCHSQLSTPLLAVLTCSLLADVGQIVVAGHVIPFAVLMSDHNHAVFSSSEEVVWLIFAPVLILLQTNKKTRI